MMRSGKLFYTKRIGLVVVAIILTMTLIMPGTAFAREYDPTDPREYNTDTITEDGGEQGGNEQDTTSQEVSSSEESSDTEAISEETSEQTSVTPVDQTTHKSTTATKATKAKTTVIIQTKAVKSKSYKGKNATRIPIITYHRVISDKEKKRIKGKNSSLFISVSMFRKQMRWLHKHNYRTISTQEFYDWYTGKIKLPKKSVLITFDDGSYSVIKYALPVLKKYNMKATFFIIGKKTHARTNKKAIAPGRYHCTGLDLINRTIKKYPKFEFQSHTYNMHRRIKGKAALQKTSYAAQKKDFKTMHDKYGFTFLAYPYGTYTKTSVKAARAAHVKMAFTYGKNAFATKKQGRYAIRRIKINGNQSMKKFYKWFK
ncbi:MAG: polysaccharide deacetylase family protein [Firmicutes bacterium]|nr:polysaccharide deacetylase family protein [Bacillota bacterium]